MIEVKAPNLVSKAAYPQVFLAGSIEQGTAADWQAEVVSKLAGRAGTIWNPRRAVWDSTWKQDINNPQFHTQVTWELSLLEDSSHVLMYFDPTTKSPITLLELGIICSAARHHFVASESLFVCCPEGYWRKGNVDITCRYFGVTLYHTLAAAVLALQKSIDKK